ncbi:hypothetical protein M514_08062 [Trichuris suis]|uniref:Uncharacterized protein n=1 Tax=Trichuris suis TaxID=68888 RepID=A0A085NUT9_9BILA|nr:hypothetical protein M513_08062 [Trichuris suis]KFD73235.1 hypothetical protein M514_08062 [Trichuris suis]
MKFRKTDAQVTGTTALLDANSAVTTQELAEVLDAHRTTVCLHLHGTRKIQKYGKWVPHSLSQSAKTDRLNTCKELLKNDRKKVFCGELSRAMKNGSYMTTPKEKTLDGPRSSDHIHTKGQHLWVKGAAVRMMGPPRRALP